MLFVAVITLRYRHCFSGLFPISSDTGIRTSRARMCLHYNHVHAPNMCLAYSRSPTNVDQRPEFLQKTARKIKLRFSPHHQKTARPWTWVTDISFQAALARDELRCRLKSYLSPALASEYPGQCSLDWPGALVCEHRPEVTYSVAILVSGSFR